MFRIGVLPLIVLIQVCTLTACRSQAPLPRDFQNRVLDLVEAAKDQDKGVFFAPDAEATKQQRDEILTLLNEQIENELNFVGQENYPGAAQNAEDLIGLANQVVNLDDSISNKEAIHSFAKMAAVNRGFSSALWDANSFKSFALHFFGGLAGPYVVWGVTDGFAFLLDLVSGWDSTTIQEPVALNEEQLLKLEALKVRLAALGRTSPPTPTVPASGQHNESRGLTMTVTYALNDTNDQRASWNILAERGIAPGEKETGFWLFKKTNSLYYNELWKQAQDDVKEWLSENTTSEARVIRSFLSVRVGEKKENVLITGRINVDVALADQANFIRWVREDYQLTDEIVTQVEAFDLPAEEVKPVPAPAPNPQIPTKIARHPEDLFGDWWGTFTHDGKEYTLSFDLDDTGYANLGYGLRILSSLDSDDHYSHYALLRDRSFVDYQTEEVVGEIGVHGMTWRPTGSHDEVKFTWASSTEKKLRVTGILFRRSVDAVIEFRNEGRRAAPHLPLR